MAWKPDSVNWQNKVKKYNQKIAGLCEIQITLLLHSTEQLHYKEEKLYLP